MLTRFLLLPAFGLVAAAGSAHAQCSFTPTVAPNNLILCPQATDTLRTQVYDAYQWYKDGQPIAGATGQTYVVEQFRDAGSQFSVEATLNACTEMSAQVLVDGWVFAGLTVMSSGSFGIDPNDGHAIICDSSALHPRDTVIFEVMQPYTTNVQWYRNGQPISSATRPALRVTVGGTYDVEGSPQVCPTFSQRSLPLDVELRRPLPPSVALAGGQLVGTPAAGATYRAWQWFRDGVAVPGATASTHTPTVPGLYRVQGDDGMCWAVSAGFRWPVTGVAETAETVGIRCFPNPVAAAFSVESPQPVGLSIRSLTGAEIARYAVAPPVVSTREWPTGLYFAHFTTADGRTVRPVKLVKVAE